MTNLTSALNFGALITLSCCNAVLQIAAVPGCNGLVEWHADRTTQLPPMVQPGVQGRLRATGIESSRCDRSKPMGANRPMKTGADARNAS